MTDNLHLVNMCPSIESIETTMTERLHLYFVLQFSHGTDSLILANDRHLYPYFFRTAISMASFDDLRVSFIRHFPHWTEVGIVYGDNLLDAQVLVI